MAYFSNSSEGAVLDAQCLDCLIPDNAPCPILWVQLEYNYTQLGDGNEKLEEAMNCLVNEDGECQMKPILDAIKGDRG